VKFIRTLVCNPVVTSLAMWDAYIRSR